MPDESNNMVKYLLTITVLLLALTVALYSYSTTGYTLVKYPGRDGDAVVCVEGEVSPSNQTLTIINADSRPTENPYVNINGVRYEFNLSVSDKAVRQRSDALRLGCNRISFGAQSDTQFEVRIDYQSHWRPTIDYLEVNNLLVGHASRYFIATHDAAKRPVVMSRLNITDVSKDTVGNPKFDAQFNGSVIRYTMEQPGNYKADMQAFDGYVWSDVYEVGFTVHVIQTDEQKLATRLYEVPDDPVQENNGPVPVAVKPGDYEVVKLAKRAVDGTYMLYKAVSGFVRSYVPL
jgi:hypothetical protein